MKDLRLLWRWTATAGAVVLLALAVAACGGDDSSSGTTAAATEAETSESSGSGGDLVAEAQKTVEEAEVIPAEISSAPYGSFKPKADQTIFFASCELAIEGCSNMVEGAKEAVKPLGYKLEVCAANGSDPESGQKCLDQAVAVKPDAILYLGLEQLADAWYPKAKAAGIPVVGMFAGPKKGAADVQVAGGELAAVQARNMSAYLIASTEGKAHALIPWAAGYDSVIQKKDVIEEELAKCAECSTTDLEFDPVKVQEGFAQQVTSALQTDSELNIVAGTFSVPAAFAVPAVRELGRPDVQVTAFDGTAPNLELLREGDILKADDGNGSREPGWTAIDIAARLIVGEKVPFDVPVQTLLMTTKNIGELPEGFRGADNFEQQYEELWGLR